MTIAVRPVQILLQRVSQGMYQLLLRCVASASN